MDDAYGVGRQSGLGTNTDIEYDVRRGAALIISGDLARAVSLLSHVIALRPDHAGAWNSLGLALHGQGDLGGAVECYGRALQLNPDDVEVDWNRALAWLAQGDYARGWPEYEWR